MNYQEIENKLVEFAHKKEGKDLPIHYVSIGTAVDFAIELLKNCPIPVVVGEIEQCTLHVCMRSVYSYAVTGTFHGSIIEAESEAEARRIFHKHYNGESITHIRKR